MSSERRSTAGYAKVAVISSCKSRVAAGRLHVPRDLSFGADELRTERDETHRLGCHPGQHRRAPKTTTALAMANHAMPSRAYCSQTTNM